MLNCTSCKAPLPLDERHFFRDAKSKTGFRRSCKDCCRKKDPRRNGAPVLHPGVAAEALSPPTRAPDRALPPLLAALEGDPVFEELMEAQGRGRPLPAPKGIYGPLKVTDEQRPERLWTIILITDIHVPDKDPGYWKALLQFLVDVQPDEIIIMGDFLELESCSMHKGADLIAYAKDIDAGNQALDELQAAAPKAKYTYLEGNHETRLSRFLADVAPTLAGALSIPSSLRLTARGIVWVPEDQQPIARADIDILHGHQISRMLPKHHAMRAVEIYGRPGRTVTYGHTHKPQIFTRPSVDGTIRGVGLGCGRTLNPRWLHGSQAGWELEFGVIYVKPDQRTNYYQVKVDGGTFTWNGKLYGGE